MLEPKGIIKLLFSFFIWPYFELQLDQVPEKYLNWRKKPGPMLLGFYHALAVNEGALSVSIDVRATREANIMIQLLGSPSESVLAGAAVSNHPSS